MAIRTDWSEVPNRVYHSAPIGCRERPKVMHVNEMLANVAVDRLEAKRTDGTRKSVVRDARRSRFRVSLIGVNRHLLRRTLDILNIGRNLVRV